MRSHDQFNTTIYGHNDRYRGIKKGRDVVFVNPDDLAELGLGDGQRVDIHGEYQDERGAVLRNYRVVSYPTARGLRGRVLSRRRTCWSRWTAWRRAATRRCPRR